MPQLSRYLQLSSAYALMGFVVGLHMLFVGGSCHAGEWTVDGSTSKDVSTETTVDGTTTDVSKTHSFSLDFDTVLAPTLEFSSSFSFDVGEETPDSDFPSSTYDTSVSGDLSAQWWSFSATWDQGVAKSEDPATPTELTWSYGFEVKIEPEYEDLPEASYALDGDKESISRNYQGAFEYNFLEILDITLDASRDLSDPRPGIESDSDARTLSASVAFSRELTDNLSFDADWSVDRSQELTLTSSGLLLEKVDTQDKAAQAALEYTPLEWIETSVSRDVSWAKDLMLPDLPVEREETTTAEISFSPTITKTIEASLSHSDDRGKSSGSEAETRTWAQSIASTLDFTPLENVSFNASYDRSYDRTIPTAPGEVAERSRDDSYDFGFEVAIFDDQINYSISRTFGYAWTQGVETANDSSWDHSLDLTWENIPNLSFAPTYTLTREANHFEGTRSSARSISADVTYAVELGGVTSIELSHSYSRDADYPDGEASYISRSDSTSITVGLDDFLSGMSTDFTLERSASDESGDDLGPEVDFTHSFSFDWEILEEYTFGFSYDHDMPQEAEDSENYSSELSFSVYEGKIQFSFNYERSIQLQGEKSESSSYGIEVSGEL